MLQAAARAGNSLEIPNLLRRTLSLFWGRLQLCWVKWGEQEQSWALVVLQIQFWSESPKSKPGLPR